MRANVTSIWRGGQADPRWENRAYLTVMRAGPHRDSRTRQVQVTIGGPRFACRWTARSQSAAPDTGPGPGRALVAGSGQRRLAAREPRRQTSLSGHSRMLRRAASRMSCASMPARDSAMPNAGHSQTNSSGPAGGSGHVHHRETNECGPPPPANGYRTGPAGSPGWPACIQSFQSSRRHAVPCPAQIVPIWACNR